MRNESRCLWKQNKFDHFSAKCKICFQLQKHLLAAFLKRESPFRAECSYPDLPLPFTLELWYVCKSCFYSDMHHARCHGSPSVTELVLFFLQKGAHLTANWIQFQSSPTYAIVWLNINWCIIIMWSWQVVSMEEQDCVQLNCWRNYMDNYHIFWVMKKCQLAKWMSSK